MPRSVPVGLILVLALVGFVRSSEDEAKPETSATIAPLEVHPEESRAHWAYQPLTTAEPPEVVEAGWVRNPIDRFILAGLEEMGFSHAPQATGIELIRRVTFDLTGLPPTISEVEAFLADERPDAYERLVDRLLASPHHGERQAQHWLDLAHYADTNGFELDAERPDAWRYRDWVIAALDADMPYDEFLALQIAGDELRPGNHSALIATGFGRCGPREVVGGNIDPRERRQSELTEVTGTVGSVFLGMTMACARCHDHKFDALPATDYYRLQAFFAAAQFVEKAIAADDEERAFDEAKKEVDARLAPYRQQQAELEAPYRKALRDEKERNLTEAERAVLAIPDDQRDPIQKKMAEGVQKALNVTWEEVAEAVQADPEIHVERERLKREIHDITLTLPPPPARAMALAEDGTKKAPKTYVQPRGDFRAKGPLVTPRPPGVILANQSDEAFPEAIAETETTTGRRAALAGWLGAPENPLTARVMVNRLWQWHYGRGIVATPSDFGVRGEPPSHPELLDWLASRLIDSDWRLKPIRRLMVTSAAYRQSSSRFDPQQRHDDPDNMLLGRMNRRRMEAESIRDALLFASGELNPKREGRGVRVPIEKEIEDLIFTEAEEVDLWPEHPDPAEHGRRSLYLYRKRNVRYPLFDAFDAPDTQTACPQRDVSTHALQPLILINSGFAIDRGKAFAARLLREADGLDSRIDLAYQHTLARSPKPEEVAQAREFLASQTEYLRERAEQGGTLATPSWIAQGLDPAEGAAWVDFALAMLNRNEFVYVP